MDHHSEINYHLCYTPIPEIKPPIDENKLFVFDVEVFELVKVYSTVSIVIHFLEQLCCESFLDWNLKLYEHLLKFIKAQKIHFVGIKFFKELFQDKLLVSTFGPLNQLESDEFYSAFYFLWLNFL